MNTKEKAEVMLAAYAGAKIEGRFRSDPVDQWETISGPSWDWARFEYRVVPEPKKQEGRWDRVEIIEKSDGYCLAKSRNGWFRIPDLQNIPGFGGIDYKSPFDPKVIVRSTVPLMFTPSGTQHFSAGTPSSRPGIPVAAWFWREEQ